MTLDEFFAGFPESWAVFEALRRTVETLGPSELRVSRSQVTFWRRRAVVRAWIPARPLRGRGAPLVLTFGFRYRHASPRWKEIVEPAPGRFTHHVELFVPADVDEEICGWLREAWQAAA